MGALPVLAASLLAANPCVGEDAPRRLIPTPAPQIVPYEAPGSGEIEATELEAQGVAALSVGPPACPLPWLGTSHDEIDLAFSAMPDHGAGPVVRELTRMTVAPGIETAGEQQTLFARRLDLLLGHGEFELFDDLIRQAPDSAIDDRIVGLEIARALVGGTDPSMPCDALQGSDVDTVEWRVACAAQANDPTGVGLHLSLAKERGMALDPALQDLASTLAEGGIAASAVARNVDRWPAAALLQIVPIDAETLDPNTVPAAAALFLAGNNNLPQPLRHRLARRAAVFGLFDRNDLWRRSGDPARDSIADALARESVRSARLQLLRALWSQTPRQERTVTAQLLAPEAMEIQLDPAFVWGADALVPILFLADRPDLALSWLDLVERHGGQAGLDEEVRARLAVAGAMAGTGIPVEMALGDPYLTALLAGLGIDATPAAVAPAGAASPSITAWLGLEASVERGACSAASAHSLALLGEDPAAASPVALLAVLRALAAFGLTDEARRLAVSVALVRPLDE